ncbi:hypothetical protein BDF21DRAFT_395385 [Thamnidium elegans]|nr:hypothetical protein BDF21DRAFT_395385 [Thamnidium elegans]
MSSSSLPYTLNSNKRIRLMDDTCKHTCDICKSQFSKLKELYNHKRIHAQNTMPSEKETVEIDDIFNADDMDVEDHLDYSSDPMEEDESFEEFSYSDIYSVPYKTGCTFEENEGQSHIYHQSNVGQHTFTITELLSIHLFDIVSDNNGMYLHIGLRLYLSSD